MNENMLPKTPGEESDAETSAERVGNPIDWLRQKFV